MNPSVEVSTSVDGRTTVRFTLMDRPWTTNAERKGNRWQRASKTAEWRELFGWLARCTPLPVLTDATVQIDLIQKGRLQDTGACHPAIKAAIDGMVDANLFTDDTGEHIKQLVFVAPQRGKHDQVTITIQGTKVGAGA